MAYNGRGNTGIHQWRARCTNIKRIENQSKGFLFLADHGGPINNRGTITHIFREAARGLAEKGLLSRDPRDPYLNDESYEFSAYLLRTHQLRFITRLKLSLCEAKLSWTT